MDTVGWVATIVVAAITIFTVGYWFGYRCGQEDAKDGVREP
jgi:hypothetical protein